jgi:hypothetical protein
MRKAYWSLLCFPLMIACLGATISLDRLGYTGPAGGFAIIGLYMFVFQVVWAYLADRVPFSVGDIVTVISYVVGSCFALALIFCSSREPLSLQLMLGAIAAPLVGAPLSSVCEHFFGHFRRAPQEPGHAHNQSIRNQSDA